MILPVAWAASGSNIPRKRDITAYNKAEEASIDATAG